VGDVIEIHCEVGDVLKEGHVAVGSHLTLSLLNFQPRSPASLTA
jgi:hypothetical protein